MALFRKFFYKKPPDGLLEITERVYVFDYCFTADVMEENELKVYIGGIVRQLHDHFHDASFMVFNMREGENQSQISNILSDYDMTVMDYPRQYEGCPLLTMEMIHHFLRSGESWLQLGQQNVVLMHCERGGWPVLAFMLAALLIYRKQFTGEQKTLDMIYKQAPRELLQLMSPLNPLPSQLRYLQYISRRNVGSEWPPLDRALTLDCVIIRHIPKMDGEGGCRPIFRIYGPDPFMAADRTPKVLFSTPKRSKLVRYYKQADCELVKIDINCHVQGDVVLECISLDSDLEREHMMFRVMFNTAFIRSNILMLNRDEIDILWNAKDNFPKDFRVEVLFSDMEASSSVISIDLPRIEDKEGLPVEAFAKVKEMFNNVDWLDSNTEVANVLQQITASNILLERLDSGVSSPTGNLLKESLSGRFKFDSKTQNDMKSSKLSISSFGTSEDAPTEKKIELLESKALPENNIKTLEPMDQGEQAIPSAGLSTDSNSTKMQIEALDSKASLENVTDFPISVAQGKKPTPLIEPSIDANSMKKKVELLESKQKEIESLDSKALLENDRRFKFEPKALPEIDIKSLRSAVHGKLSMFSFESPEDAPMEKMIETLESKALPENNMKTLAPVDQGKQPILSSDLSTHPNSTKMQIEPFQSEALLENVTKFPASVAQEKKSTPLIEPPMDGNLVKRKIGPLESIEKDSESLELKTLLQNDDNCPKSMAQEKQSIPLTEPSMDANSMKKEIGQLESKVLSANDMKSLTSTVQGKQDGPLLELPIDANSIKKMIEPKKLQVAIQLPTQSKIISPRVRQAVRSAPVSYSNSLQGSPVGMSRYHSAPSALGLTTVLQDRAPMDIKEVTEEMTVSPPSSTSPPSNSKVPKSVEPSSASVPPASSPVLLPYSASTSSVDALSSIVKTSGPLVSASPPPPPSPPQCVPTSKLMQPTATKHPETTMHDKGQKSSVTPPPPPPPPLPVQDMKSSLSIPASSTAEPSTPSYAAKSTSISHLPSSSLPGTSLSTVKDSFKGPPPPSSPPPPPPLSGLPSSAAYPLSSPSKSPPPPPPPPGHSGTTPAPILTSSVPPPPPPPASASKTPPPPPPPASPSKISSSNNSAVPVPPVPPPPSPSANGLSKSDTAPLQSPVPPIPGPPSGVPFGAKGRGLFRANPKGQSQTKRSNLKPYHWLKLTRAVHGSLWAETQKLDEASKAPEFDMSELETLFSAAAPNSDGKGGKSNRRTSRQKVDKVQLIELRRAYNCEIMLTKVKIPLPDLMSAVLALDDSVLYVDQVENLIKFCPTKEEMELLKNYTGDKDNLGKCEQFFLELMKVPRVENKLRVFSFKMQFCTQVAELRRDLNIVNSASEEIRNSIKLKRIMQTILSLGNALNHGTARGSAIGFRLDSLLKLTDTRARNNKMTLMHYLCKVLAEKLPELLDFPKDLVNLEGSTKIQLKYLAEEMQAISKGLEKVVQELTASENDGPVSESFCQTLKEFLGVAEAEVRSLALLYANVGRNADALALYFGEDPTRVPFEQVVSTLQNFVKMFIRAHDENCKQLEYEKKRAEKEAEKLAPKKDSELMIRTTIKSGNSK